MDVRPSLGVFTEDPAGYLKLFGRPAIFAWYQAIGSGSVPDEARLRLCVAMGALPMITLEPWCHDRDGVPSADPLSDLLRGRFDRELRAWAAALKQFGKPVLVRFGHEMNGDWYPWAVGGGLNTSYDWLAAYWRTWRIVGDAPNVLWVWGPNVSYPGSIPLERLYPGEDCVDYVALDGYNWGSPWMTPQQIFDASIREVRRICAKPVIIGETGCAEDRRKPEWIWALRNVDVGAIVWFDLDKERNWAITSSAASARAYHRLARLSLRGPARTREEG